MKHAVHARQLETAQQTFALADVLRRAGLGSLAELIFLTHNFDFPAPARGRLGEGASRWFRSDVDAWIHSDARARYRLWQRRAA